jgi:hypothetical protein
VLFHVTRRFAEAFNSQFMKLRELLLLKSNDFGVLFQIVFKWKYKIVAKSRNLLEKKTNEEWISD